MHSSVKPTNGGIYTEATIGSVRYLNPLDPNATSVDRDIHKLTHEGLLTYNAKTQQVEDGLAELSVHDRGREYRLKLRPNLKFSNGEPIDIADVLYTYQDIIQNPNFGNKDLVDVFQYIDISVIDNETIAFKLPEKNIFLATFLTQPILPKKSFDGALIQEILDPDFPANLNPVGAGPYFVKNIIPEDGGFTRVFLQKNPYYYKSEPFLEQVVIYVYPNVEILKVSHPWPDMFSRIPFKETESFIDNLYDEYNSKEFVLPKFTALFFNLDKKVAGNLYLRQALALSQNSKDFVESDWINLDSPLFYNAVAGKNWTPDYRKARQLLEDINYEYDRDSEKRLINGEDPVKLTLLTTLEPTVYSRYAQQLKTTWEQELSIEVEIKLVPINEFKTNLESRDYDMVLYGQDFTDNFDVLSPWHSSQSNKLNLSNLTRDDIDFYISEIRFTGARSDYQQLQNRLDELIPILPIGAPRESVLVRKSLNDFDENYGTLRQLSDRFWSIEKWYFDSKKDWDIPDHISKIQSYFKWLTNGQQLLSFPDKKILVEEDLINPDAEVKTEAEAETTITETPNTETEIEIETEQEPITTPNSTDEVKTEDEIETSP